jgi:hypothetical protein
MSVRVHGAKYLLRKQTCKSRGGEGVIRRERREVGGRRDETAKEGGSQEKVGKGRALNLWLNMCPEIKQLSLQNALSNDQMSLFPKTATECPRGKLPLSTERVVRLVTLHKCGVPGPVEVLTIQKFTTYLVLRSRPSAV